MVERLYGANWYEVNDNRNKRTCGSGGHEFTGVV